MPTPAADPIAELLERGVITPGQLERCRADCPSPGDPAALLATLIRHGCLDAVELSALGWSAGVGAHPSVVVGELVGPGPAEPQPESRCIAGVERGSLHSADFALLADRTAPATPPPEGRRVGPYRIVRELGRGGMGAVYEALDSRLGRRVALKGMTGPLAGLSEVAAERFRREARATAKLRHPAIVPVHEILESDGECWIVLEHLDAQPLGDHLRRAGTDPLATARLLLPVAEALAYAHEQGVLHRDLTPDNILVDEHGRATVVDFGLARLGTEADERRLTEDGALLGTPHYMAPEQARGDHDAIGPRTDVHGFGAVLYEALTGRPPFSGTTLFEILEKVALVAPVPPSAVRPEVPNGLDAICLCCLEKEPEARYASAGAVAADLRRFLSGEPVAARRNRLARWRDRARRRWAHLAAAAALALLLTAIVLVVDRQQQAAERRWGALLERTAQGIAGFEDAVRSTRLTTEARKTLERQSLALLEPLLAEAPGDGVALAWRGRILALLERRAEAEADLEAACAASPHHPVVWYLRGTDAIDRYAALRPPPTVYAGPHGLTFGAAAAEDAATRTLLARGLADLTRMEAAAAAAPVGSAFGERERRLGAARAAVFGPDPDGPARALTLCAGLLGPEVETVRARAWYRLGRFDSAIQAVDQVLARWPEDPRAWRSRGQAWFARGLERALAGEDPREDLAAAIRDQDEVLARLPEDLPAHLDRAQARIVLAQAEHRAGIDPRPRIREALRDLARVQESTTGQALSSTFAAAWVALGEAEEARGGDAASCYRKAIEATDRTPASSADAAQALSNRAMAMGLLARRAGATPAERAAGIRKSVAEADRSIAADPRLGWAWRNRASLRRMLAVEATAQGGDPGNDWEAAESDLSAVLRLEPRDAEARAERAFLRRQLAQREAARGGDAGPWLNASLEDRAFLAERRPADAALWSQLSALRFELALADAKHGRDARSPLEEAVRDADRSIAAGDNAPARGNRGVALLHLAQLQMARGEDPDETCRRSIEDSDEALRLDPALTAARQNRASAWLVLGMARSSRGESPKEAFASAEADFRAAVEAGNLLALLNLGILQRALGRYDEAIESFEAAARALPAWADRARAQIEATRKQRAAGNKEK